MAMQGSRFWVVQGSVRRAPTDGLDASSPSEKKRFEDGEVRVTSGDIGTEIKWHAQTPCVASLFFLLDWLRDAKTPIVLRFHVSGWFEEFYPTTREATERIEAIIARGDRHFPVRTFVEEVDPKITQFAPLLTDILNKKEEPAEYSVVCAYNELADKFEVAHIGEKSPIAKFYGTFLTSFPCTGTSYADRVSAGYREVLASGRPRTDHVLAAFRLPDNQVHWVPYHRLIVPAHEAGRHNSVNVISQISPISFKVI